MSTKKLVCQGAICKCQYGVKPDTLQVLTQSKTYINDIKGKSKLMATDKELGNPFKTKTFGTCKLQPSSNGNLACVPNITAWNGSFDKLQLESNQGYPLVEDSKATCAIAGSPCVEITYHGQVAEPTMQNVKNLDRDPMSQLLPMLNIMEIDDPSNTQEITLTEK